MRISKVVHQLLLAATVKATHDEDVEFDRNDLYTWDYGGQSGGTRDSLVDGFNATFTPGGNLNF